MHQQYPPAERDEIHDDSSGFLCNMPVYGSQYQHEGFPGPMNGDLTPAHPQSLASFPRTVAMLQPNSGYPAFPSQNLGVGSASFPESGPMQMPEPSFATAQPELSQQRSVFPPTIRTRPPSPFPALTAQYIPSISDIAVNTNPILYSTPYTYAPGIQLPSLEPFSDYHGLPPLGSLQPPSPSSLSDYHSLPPLQPQPLGHLSDYRSIPPLPQSPSPRLQAQYDHFSPPHPPADTHAEPRWHGQYISTGTQRQANTMNHDLVTGPNHIPLTPSLPVMNHPAPPSMRGMDQWHSTPLAPRISVSQISGAVRERPHPQKPTSSLSSTLAPYPSSIRPIQGVGRKRALCIGINYKNAPHSMNQDNYPILESCVEDVVRLRDTLESNLHYDDILLLVDDDVHNRDFLPTEQNIIRGMQWLVEGAISDDMLFFHFSGHGDQVDDQDGDEEDFKDEVIVSWDFRKIIDDDIWTILVSKLPKGCRLTAVFDCCHSGSALDLPFIYDSNGNIKSPGLGQRFLNTINRTKKIKKNARLIAMTRRTSEAIVISLGACQDHQKAYEHDTEGGAMSRAFQAVIAKYTTDPVTCHDILLALRERLVNQKPQLSTAHQMDLKTVFFNI